MLVESLAPGKLDIVGDIHGEIEPLRALLQALGYDADGRHDEGRRLVFVGDLVDRGPHSARVVRLVARLVGEGRAQCVLGNHELNILRESRKHDNEWFFEGTPRVLQREIRAFLETLPLALERPDLRVVHACWDEASVHAARQRGGRVTDYFHEAERAILRRLSDEGVLQAADREKGRYPLDDEDRPPPESLMSLADAEVRKQVENPVKVLTSGIECIASAPFWANGKWRFAQRVPWWNDYDDDTMVVVGHYWRSRDGGLPFVVGEPGLFGDASPTAPLGTRGRVMCIDYSIGQRPKERAVLGPRGPFRSALAAYRWHENAEPELVFSPG